MKYYPVYLDIIDKNCLIVGGGSVGARKVLTLVRAGGKVTVVSPDFSKRFLEKTFQCKIRKITRPYEPSDMETMFLVMAATDNMQLNRQIASDAQKCGILCNIADYPQGSSFILPSIVQQGDLLISISTSGNSPALAKKLRSDLEQQFGDEYARFLILMGRVRNRLLSRQHAPDQHAVVFRQLVNSDLINRIALNDALGIEEILSGILNKLPGNIHGDLYRTNHDTNQEPSDAADNFSNKNFPHDLTPLYQDLILTSTLPSEDS